MSEYLNNLTFDKTREYRFKEFRRFTRTRPYDCQGLMKNFWQCFDYFHFQKNEEEPKAYSDCMEKFNYEECLTENKPKLWENWKYNAKYAASEEGGEEEEEEEWE